MNDLVTILFATESGNAEDLARRFFARAQGAGLSAELHNVSECRAADLAGTTTLILFTSTWGSGEPPVDAQDFHDELLSAAMPELPHLAYAVFGLGDTGYGDDFCACARRLDERLEQLGAARLLPVAQADTDFEPTYADWEPRLLARLLAPAGHPAA